MIVLDDIQTVEQAAQWVRLERSRRGWSAKDVAEGLTEIAKRVDDEFSITQQAISQFETGRVKKFPAWLRYFDLMLMSASVDDRVKLSEPQGEEAPSAVVEQTINVPMIDLAYGMGGTYLEDDPETRTEPFALSFIRRYTSAKAADLVFAEGLGDSMAPTIHTSDLLLIDQSDRTLRMSDQIWAFSFGGLGMIKRLRQRPDGSIAILSDNPNVSDDRAVDDELHLIGRVVAKVSKI